MFDTVNSYYKFHSKIYDLTRWSILFGRNRILNLVPDFGNRNVRILELGCGTGYHLPKLSKLYPSAEIIGIDDSLEMIGKAKKKYSDNDQISIKHISCRDYLSDSKKFDLIFCSYSLTMISEYQDIIKLSKSALCDVGFIAVVDFSTTPFLFFEKWMKWNHVDVSGDIFKQLRVLYKEESFETKKAYLGLWKYALFVGCK